MIFLNSDAASYISGENLNTDGGTVSAYSLDPNSRIQQQSRRSRAGQATTRVNRASRCRARPGGCCRSRERWWAWPSAPACEGSPAAPTPAVYRAAPAPDHRERSCRPCSANARRRSRPRRRGRSKVRRPITSSSAGSCRDLPSGMPRSLSARCSRVMGRRSDHLARRPRTRTSGCRDARPDRRCACPREHLALDDRDIPDGRPGATPAEDQVIGRRTFDDLYFLGATAASRSPARTARPSRWSGARTCPVRAARCRAARRQAFRRAWSRWPAPTTLS